MRDDQAAPTLAERIASARARKGLTLSDIAERMGSSPQSVQKAAKGTKAPTLEWVYRLAIALEVPPSSLDDRLRD